jgi:hypothetical protein
MISDALERANFWIKRSPSSISSPRFVFQNIRQIVRILHLHYKTTCFPCENAGSEATRATHWTTHQGARQRTRRRSMCKHARAWTCRKAKAIGQKCEKPWENQGFAAERTGTEQLAKSLGKSKFRNEAAQNPTRAEKQTAHRLRTSNGSRIPVTACGTRTTKDWLHPQGRCILVLLMENNLEIGT